MNGSRILLTGATGFVGRAVAAALAAHGHALTFSTRGRAPASVPDMRWVEVGPIGAGTVWDDALRDVGVVINLAAHVHVSPERAAAEAHLFDEVNHRGALRLFEAAAARDVGLFIQMSSITVLGAATSAGRPFTDRSPPDPQTPYAHSKFAAEQALAAAAAARRTRLVLLRPPLIAGPGVAGNLGRLIRLAALPVPLPLGRMRNRRTLLSLDNLVSAIETVLVRGRDAAATYVLGDHAPISTSDIVAALRHGLGRRPLLWPAPIRPAAAILASIGRAGLAQRLFDDLEVDSSGFRQAFAWSDVVETRACLREAARRSRG